MLFQGLSWLRGQWLIWPGRPPKAGCRCQDCVHYGAGDAGEAGWREGLGRREGVGRGSTCGTASLCAGVLVTLCYHPNLTTLCRLGSFSKIKATILPLTNK